jgi:hypothetical protein
MAENEDSTQKMTGTKAPPQFVFEIIATQAVRYYLVMQLPAEKVVPELARVFGTLYDDKDLEADLHDAMSRVTQFFGSIKISNIDLFLLSFMFFVSNFENAREPRNKRPFLGGLLKHKPKELARVYMLVRRMKSYAFALSNGIAPLKPVTWRPEDEEELAPIFSLLFPKVEKTEEQLELEALQKVKI